MKNLIGKPLHEAMAQITQANKTFRIHREGVESIITADFNPDRLEVTVDNDGNVTKVE